MVSKRAKLSMTEGSNTEEKIEKPKEDAGAMDSSIYANNSSGQSVWSARNQMYPYLSDYPKHSVFPDFVNKPLKTEDQSYAKESKPQGSELFESSAVYRAETILVVCQAFGGLNTSYAYFLYHL